MFRRSFQWFVVLLAVILILPAAASAAEFHGRLAGTQVNTTDDTDGDGMYIAHIEGTGRFTQLGKMTARGINEGLPWDGSFCSATELRLDTFYFHMILSAENGDMLFSEQSSVELCYDFIDFTWTATHHFDITGGTGKFAQATGQFDCENEGSPLLTPLNDPVGYTWETVCQGSIENID